MSPANRGPSPRKPRNRNGVDRECTACGRAVEASLERSGVLLTMGGEPTFVPLHPDGPEWSTAALGPTKLDYARRLARQVIADFHPGAVILETTGKHYPGEPLPRWAILIQRRCDGAAVWRDPSRLKGDLTPGRQELPAARAVVRRLAQRLGLAARSVHALIRPDDGRDAVGYVLPLDHSGEAWSSDDWREDFPGGEVPLLPGDSHAGLRLPLGALGPDRLRRALTAEIREGAVALFIPPLLAPAYLELLRAIEDTLEELDVADVLLAGYAPPPDSRLLTLGLASDPGVLEVNLVPCATWDLYDRQLRRLYRAAARVGLKAGKLQFNGRATGTGGGAHLVFGGPDGLLSPFFAFPRLLPSLIRYLQWHPALSFAFTGLYLGPSSQAPRIDESTYEALYELEIACAGAEQLGDPPNLPLFDLLFRDLLMDRSGNTHRAELSVDKLWNPFAGNGRLGLVELRAFESHPDPAILSRIGLLMRAILARLAASPVSGPFIRWGGTLHDRFLLPAFLWEDLRTVAADLAAHGIPFDLEWLRSFWEWRFPEIGSLHATIPGKDGSSRKATIRFRQALEAWPLLGETPNAGTVSRTVDASMDRIEAQLGDADLDGTGMLLVNGIPCRFQPTDGGAAGGIRFRAFHLFPSLHPHIPPHAPLLLEWVDRSSLTVVDAARWHVWNPLGEPYPDRPVTAAEARRRFAGRWEPWPHTVGQGRWIPEARSGPESQYTLDLRRHPAQSRA